MSAGFERKVSPVLLLVTAPSGVGKTTVGSGLLASVPGLVRAITCTTRAPRTGERDGVDYHFLAPADFAARLEAGEFLEHAEVYGNRYGTLRSEVLRRLDEGSDVLLTVDVQGAETIRNRARSGSDERLGRSLVSVFIMPSSLAELERRLRGRGQDTEEVVARRLGVARSEMEAWPHLDYVVVSGTREADLAAMQGILAVERLRSGRTERLVVD
jgi:guanylate kinase